MVNESNNIVLGVTGGIAAYKAADLCSKLTKAGASVRVAFSKSAHEFVTPLVFEALSGNPVYQHVLGTSSAFQMDHISWARWADKLVIAPASADTIARLAGGLADDAITTLYLAFRGTVYVAPSMNTTMLEHPATQSNLKILKERGAVIIEPGEGSLACGETGSGRMAEPSDIMHRLGFNATMDASDNASNKTAGLSRPPDHTLKNISVLITSGPTREYLDPVRFISSPSSGKMGLALANEARRRGAEVHFVTGPVSDSLLPGDNVCVYPVESARDMLQKAQELKARCELFIFAAAVGDFRPAQSINQKIKRTGNSITLPLVENPDISQSIAFSKHPGQVMIGFAAETRDHDSNAQTKLEAKRLDAIVLNDVSNPDIGFSSDNNEIRIVTASGEITEISRRPKADIAFEILETAARLLDS